MFIDQLDFEAVLPQQLANSVKGRTESQREERDNNSLGEVPAVLSQGSASV